MIEKKVMFLQNSVQKEYRSRIAADREAEILNVCQNTGLTPKLLKQKENRLQIQIINGKTVLEFLHQTDCEQYSMEQMEKIIGMVCEWLSRFERHTLQKMGQTVVLDDLHLGNFLVCGDGIVGLDFESWSFGIPEENTANLLACLEGYSLKRHNLTENLCKTVRKIRNCEQWQKIENARIQKQLAIASRRLIRPLLKQSTAVIMIGGKSQRMKNQPKQELLWGGYSFQEHLLFCLDCFDRCAYSVQYDFDGRLNLEYWKDEQHQIGPLGALESILQHTQTPLVFVTPCDTPMLRREVIAKLYQELDDETDFCIAKSCDGKQHPLCGVYRKRMLSVVRQSIAQGNRRVMECLRQAKGKEVWLDEALSGCLMNVNSPESYQELQQNFKPVYKQMF